MRIVQVNSACGSGSTGKICIAVSECLAKDRCENYILYSSGTSDYPLAKQYMSTSEIKWQALKSRLCGNYGFQSKAATRRLIKEIESISPDVLQLHNLHSHNVHLEMFFQYIKQKRIKVVWTFHDCWAFTAYCPHYDMIGCDQWKMGGCYKCPQRKRYSWIFDRSRYLFEQKKKLFTDIDLTIITPSQWLADQVKQSFLKNHTVKVINNGIDLSVFYPRDGGFRSKYGLEGKYVILGVAFGWNNKKGLDVFIELSKRLSKKYQIVLVGTNDKIDKYLPHNIISLHRTQSQSELAEIYSAADLFVNPTREEVLGLTNIESNACGVPVLMFKTGGSPECIDEYSGCTVACNDIDGMEKEIIRICESNPYSSRMCVNRARQFEMTEKFEEYVKLYDSIILR